MDTSNIVRVVEDFGSYVLTTPVTRCDVGIKLLIDDIELPEAYQIDFSNSDKKGQSTTQIGDSSGVEIPFQYIQTGKDIYAFYYYVEEGYGKTVRIYHIPNKYRPDRETVYPEPEQMDIISQAIVALNRTAERTANDSAAATQAAEGAQIALGSARIAQEFAEQAARDAQGYRDEAQEYADAANQSANAAQQSEDNTLEYSRQSEVNARRAEQAANNAGFMWLEIDARDHLIYTRTDGVDVNFRIDERGHLIREVL